MVLWWSDTIKLFKYHIGISYPAHAHGGVIKHIAIWASLIVPGQVHMGTPHRGLDDDMSLNDIWLTMQWDVARAGV